MNYSRKQNTETYPTRIWKQRNRGRDILRRIKKQIDSLEDITQRKNEVEQWLAESRYELMRIYIDPVVLTPLKVSTELDLEDISQQDAIESLEEIVSDHIAALNRIVDETRICERKAQ